MDLIRAVYYHKNDSSTVFGILSNHGGLLDVTIGANCIDTKWFDLTDKDLLKLKDGIEDALRQRGWLGPLGMASASRYPDIIAEIATREAM